MAGAGRQPRGDRRARARPRHAARPSTRPSRGRAQYSQLNDCLQRSVRERIHARQKKRGRTGTASPPRPIACDPRRTAPRRTPSLGPPEMRHLPVSVPARRDLPDASADLERWRWTPDTRGLFTPSRPRSTANFSPRDALPVTPAGASIARWQCSTPRSRRSPASNAAPRPSNRSSVARRIAAIRRDLRLWVDKIARRR